MNVGSPTRVTIADFPEQDFWPAWLRVLPGTTSGSAFVARIPCTFRVSFLLAKAAIHRGRKRIHGLENLRNTNRSRDGVNDCCQSRGPPNRHDGRMRRDPGRSRTSRPRKLLRAARSDGFL